MKQFKSHKVVWGFKIIAMLHLRTVQPILKGDDDRIAVDGAFMTKHQPKVGGYYVRYEDGYESYSPADSFEKGYTEIKGKPSGSGPKSN